MKRFFKGTMPLHTSAAIRDAIQQLEFSVLPHPVYRPDLAPVLVPKIKESLERPTLQLC
uniref:Tc1-like transposase DDE domain-containing protein n=1 Tax=Arion vulgaris TaxID=1028688 RepID=A0A0B7AB33_9EUPU